MYLAHHVDCPECSESVFAILDDKSHDIIECPKCSKVFYIQLHIEAKKFMQAAKPPASTGLKAVMDLQAFLKRSLKERLSAKTPKV